MRVRVEQRALASLAAMHPVPRRRMRQSIRALAQPNRWPDVKRLRTPKWVRRPWYRIRVGRYRAAFVVIGDEVRVKRIFARDAGYDWLDDLTE